MMMSSQNLCLICCYSFQEKRSRFISADTIKSFNNFCNDINFPLFDDNDKERKQVDSNISSKSLNLPFGECITVCGDCLSLVVVYVQQKSIQMEKEDHLVQLQKAVCKAIKELKIVVEDVQCHLNSLHSTVRMGDESNLDQFIAQQKESHKNVKSFREKVLSLKTYGARRRNIPRGNDTSSGGGDNDERLLDILIKAEPMDDNGGDDDVLKENFSDKNGMSFENFEDSNSNHVIRERTTPPDDDNSTDVEDNKPSSSTRLTASGRTRRKKLRKARRQDYTEIWPEEVEEEGQIEDYSDCDANNDKESENTQDDDSDFIDEEIIKTEKRKRSRYQRNGIRPKTTAGATRRMLKKGNLLSPEKAVKWRQDLFSRVHSEPHNNAERIEGESNNSNNGTFYKIVDDHLQLRGVVVKVHEKRRMLKCMRCYKMYFEERDVVTNQQDEHVHLESLMRNHILSKHFVAKKKEPEQEIEVMEYTSHTKSKITYKLADKNRYSYTRRCGKKDVGSSYFRCDFRKGNCSASIVHKNGKYIRLRKGWTENGFHTVHAPDVERTNKQIALGNAKYMYLTDDSKTIDEVCSIIMNQSDQQPAPLPLSKLKRAMVYSKYGSRGMAPEEKMNQTLQCCYCGKIYKEGRGLSRHMRTVHKDVSRNDDDKAEDGDDDDSTRQQPSSSTKDLRLARRSSPLKFNGTSKLDTEIQKSLSSLSHHKNTGHHHEEEKLKAQSCATGLIDHNNHAAAPPSSSSSTTTSCLAPSIVFNDPSAANNFVNRCINAIMQQVGVSVAPSSGATPCTNPPSNIRSSVVSVATAAAINESSSTSSSPNSPSVASSQQQNSAQVEHTTSTGFQPNHWQHQSSPSPSLGHYASHSTTTTATTTGNNNSSLVWQWGLH